MAEVGELDALARECNATIKKEFKKAQKKIFFWLLTGGVASLVIRLTHWLFEVPQNVNSWWESIGSFCFVMIALWFVHIPVSSVVAVLGEFRARFMSLSERLDAIENATKEAATRN
jgi:hypothetical protein